MQPNLKIALTIFAGVILLTLLWLLPSDLQKESPTTVQSNHQEGAATPMLYMSASTHEDGIGGCTLMIYLHNGYTKTIEAFAGDVTLESRSGGTERVESFFLLYIDPSNNTAQDISLGGLRKCEEIQKVRLRTVSLCKFDGALYRDCIKLVRVLGAPKELLTLD